MPFLRLVPSCGLSVGPMGPPYVANPGFCKNLSSAGNYAGASAVSGPFQAPRRHMHLGGNQTDVPDTQNPGLAMTLVPKGTTGTRAVVKKRDTGIGGLSAGGLGAMRLGIRNQ